MNPQELERTLEQLASKTDWPPTPDVAGKVVTRIATDPGKASGARSARKRRRARAGAAGLVTLVAACAAVTPVRAEVERLLGIAGGERVERVRTIPPAPARLDLGRAVTLDRARQLAGFAVVAPRDVDEASVPARLGSAFGARSVSLLLGADAILTQTPGAETKVAGKLVGPTVAVRPVDIDGTFGLWIAEGPRVLRVLDRHRRVVLWHSALPGSGVLLWDRGTLALRLETRRPLGDALRIARSLR
jgi:hypothetical protein